MQSQKSSAPQVLFPLPLIQRDSYFNKLHHLTVSEDKDRKHVNKKPLRKLTTQFALHCIHILLLENSKPHIDIPVYAKAYWMKLNPETRDDVYWM